ncbi:MucR family transcriptional regulator [Mesorhizobium sp. M1365]|uniref:MucR family transcriptional regulator n=1 Tax=Mesorhizobium sp. M1365 TaxID=2957090 RepID=UPI0033388D3E
MDEAIEKTNADLLDLTAGIVAAYVQNNSPPVAGLPDLIASVNSGLSGLVLPVVAPPPTRASGKSQEVGISRLHCELGNGRKFKSMKRHLGLLGMTPDQYRAKWGLASSKLRGSAAGPCEIYWSQGNYENAAQESTSKTER